MTGAAPAPRHRPGRSVPVPLRQLGDSGLKVSAIGLGAMPMSEFYGPFDAEACERTIRQAVDLGVTFFDTAASFGAEPHGEAANEEFLGRALHGRRDEVVIATKFGVRRVGRRRIADNSAAHIARSIDESLRRLGTDHVDLYYMHRRDPATPIEDAVGAMADLVTAGKVRYLGLSEVSGETLRRACKVHQIAAVQSEYSLMSRDIEDDVLHVARDLGAGIVAYAPLGRALLTSERPSGGVRDPHDLRSSMPRFLRQNLVRNLELVEQSRPLAEELGCSLAQLALAWLLAQGEDIVPIPGTRKVRHLAENLGACQVSLDAGQLSRLNRIFRPEAVAGERNSSEAIALMGLEAED
jgi:aryl-alcohol dehydrogenase-like predicted oxidoreductase